MISNIQYTRYNSGDAISSAEGVSKSPGVQEVKTQPSEMPRGLPMESLSRPPKALSKVQH